MTRNFPIADLTFGLDRYALPLLSVLSTLEPDFAKFDEASQMYDIGIQTHLFFAGDKRWAGLVLFPQLAPDRNGLRTVVTFGRDSHRDEIVVEIWSPVHRFAVGESPTAEDAPADIKVRRFAPRDLMLAVAFIQAELSAAYNAMRSSRDLTAQLGTSEA